MLISNKQVTATDFKISNANQYLIILEKLKLITRVWNESRTFKTSFFKDEAQRQKATEYITKFGRGKKLDEVLNKIKTSSK